MSRVAYVDGHYLPHRSAAVHIDGALVGRGRPGPLTCRLQDYYLAHKAGVA